MEAAARDGLSPEQFWRLTPREFGAFMRGRAAADRRDLAIQTNAAWHGAAFARSKRLPNLANLMRRITGEARREQTPEQGVKVAEFLNRLFGGKDKRKRKG